MPFDSFPKGYSPLGQDVTPEDIRRQPTEDELRGNVLDEPERGEPRPELEVAPLEPHALGQDLRSYTKVWPASGPVVPFDVREEAADYFQATDQPLPLAAGIVQLVGDQPNRRRLILVVTGAGDVRIGPFQNDARVGFILGAADPPLELRHRAEVWVTAVADTSISWLVELDHDRRAKGARTPEPPPMIYRSAHDHGDSASA